VSAKRIGRQNLVLLVILLAAQLFLMSGSVRGAKGAARLERLLMRISSPVVTLSELAGGAVGGTGRAVRSLLAARSRNQVLESELRRLRTELRYSREAEPENRRLRELLQMRATLAPGSIAASVVLSRTRGPSRLLVLDRGSADGVRKDQPVVAWGGAVGRVITAELGYAKVLLLTDPSSGVAGVLQRSRAQGIVFGTDGVGLEMRFVPRFSDVSHGDRVVTSGLAGIFPRGVGIGRVTSIRQAADGTQTIELVPELDYAALEEVLILTESPEGDPLPRPAAEALR
jgi:rod shape-determining protein MreC